MRYSAKIAAQARIQAMANTKPGVGEWQLEGIIEVYSGIVRHRFGISINYWIGENATIFTTQ